MPFVYPSATAFRTLEPELVARGRAGRLGIDLFPIRPVNAARVRWTQRDNYRGLQQLRGMDGEPTHVYRVGGKSYEYVPGVFGEFVDITETELTERAGSVDIPSTPIPIDDLVAEADENLIGREWDRIESSIWTLIFTGVLEIKLAGPNGLQTGYRDSYPIQTYTPVTPWTTLATATPIKDFQAVALNSIGSRVDLGAGALAVMNSISANLLINNNNASDLQGRRVEGGRQVNTTLSGVQSFMLGLGLPRIAVYDEGYLDDAGVFTKFVPDYRVAVVGKRASADRVGEYQVTRNASANYQPRSYRYVKDRANGVNAEKRTPANLEIHRGHNGGPAMIYPSAIWIMDVD